MSIKNAKRTIAILTLALAGCRGSVAPANPTPEILSLHLLSESATVPLLHDLINNYQPAQVIITWDIRVGESAAILDWLRATPSAYALIDAPATNNLLDSKLWSTPIGQDGLAIVVHPANAIPGLSAAQLRTLLQGQVNNWKSVGGPDLPVVVVARNASSGAAAIIQSMVMGNRRTTLTARLALTDQAVLDIVSATPGAIGYVSMGYLDKRVRAVLLDGILPTPDTVMANRYPLRVPILFVGTREPSNDAYRIFFAWTQSPDGQAVVRQHYGGLAN